ncbi:NAD(P)H-dependent flavin oxidoreductase [Methylobacterium nodulans]|uniref:2-nitropropane dioxygenase NPD n=1 Tax=Methylobacterium nodulans (strain LMG 21967 / CNCM I-2342 / ORS 2060) TaxID=460265 RepID=B8IW23_METNO|nr:nitronate monooxygenase [Methylobacterium nodulans]ACL62613.1 2-nitropropane dioxygenase NPD [Methylobacterium nodulans ORS 2060]
MALRTRLTDFFGIRHPIVLAPMDPAAGGALAAAVSAAGGLGLIGGGYGDREILEAEFAKAGNQRVGCGFITWSMAKSPELLDLALARKPAAMMLSFSDPAPFAEKVHAAGVPLICQVHNLDHARRALDVGASVLVAQGTDAGGHGLTTRGTITLVPSVVDLVARTRPEALVLAAGGIADGRGIAAALMLGADGALLGTRFWATQEALIHPAAKDRVVAATGDETVRTSVYDIVRNRPWPAEYTGRLMRNRFIETWHGREDELRGLAAGEREKVEAADRSGDYDVSNVTVGEAIGLVQDLPPAGELVARLAAETEARLTGVMRAVVV